MPSFLMAWMKIYHSSVIVIWIGLQPHRLMCLNSWPMGSCTIRRTGVVGVGVALLEEVNGGLRFPLLCLGSAQCNADDSGLLLPEDQDVELLASSPIACLPAGCHASCYDNNALNLWTLQACHNPCMEGRGQLQRILYFHHRISRGQTQVISLVNKHLYPRSFLADLPLPLIFVCCSK